MLEEFWEKTTALGAASIGKSLFQDSVLRLLRREIRRDTGLLIGSEDLAKALHEMFSGEAREQVGPLRIRKRRKVTRSKAPERHSRLPSWPSQRGAPIEHPTSATVAAKSRSHQISTMTKPAFDFSNLSPEQRLDLIGELWDSLENEVPPPDPEFLAELDRRLAEFEQDPTEGRSAAEVIARIRAPLK